MDEHDYDPFGFRDDLDERDEREYRPKTYVRLKTFLSRTLCAPIRLLYLGLLVGLRSVTNAYSKLPVRAQKGYEKFFEIYQLTSRGSSFEVIIDPAAQTAALHSHGRPTQGDDGAAFERQVMRETKQGINSSTLQVARRSKTLAAKIKAIKPEALCKEAKSYMMWATLCSRVATFIASNIGIDPRHIEGMYRVAKNSYVWKPTRDLKIFFNSDGVGIRTYRKTMVFTRDSFLSFSDQCQQLSTMHLTCFIAQALGEETCLTPSELNWIVNWGARVMAHFGSKGYEIIAQLEPFGTAALMTGQDGSDDPFVDNYFIENMLAEIAEGSPHMTFIVELLDYLLNLDNIHKRAEVFGLFRFMGHPVVSGEDGMEKMRRLAKKVKYVDPETSIELGAIFKEMFVRSFIRKHGRWPECKIDLPEPHFFHKCRARGIAPNPEHPDAGYQSWASITFEKNFEPPDQYNLADIMDDKSGSPTLSELKRAWDKNKTTGNAAEKKVILRWFATKVRKPTEILDKVEREGFTKEDLVIGQTPKEREMKAIPRMFSLMTFSFRMYTVLTEGMIADKILPFFPQVTMTMSDHELKRSLIAKTRAQGKVADDKGIVRVNVNIDFKKWNTNMRHDLVKHVFGDLDNLFGYQNLIKRTHIFFNQCRYYLAEDGTDLQFQGDDLVENSCCYIGSEGGNEGLRQKAWTLVTVCGIHKVCLSLKLQYQLSGQGDNQVVTLLIKDPNYEESVEERCARVKAITRQFVDDLDNFFSALGLPVKKEETWSSSRLFAYGKKLFLEGVPLSMLLKKICRAFPVSNDSIPSFEEDVARIWGSISAAVEFSHHPYASFVVGCILTSNALSLHSIYSPLLDASLTEEVFSSKPIFVDKGLTRVVPPGPVDHEQLLKSILWRPKVLGGWPVLLLDDLIIKGFPDPLTSALAQLKQMARLADPGDRKIINAISNPQFSKVVNPAMLMKDPTSLNIVTIPAPGEVMMQVTEEYLDQYPVKNVELKQVLGKVRGDMDSIANKLFRCDPYFPPFMSDIYEATATAYRERIIRKCSSTSTIRQQASAYGSEKLLQRMMTGEKNTMLLHVWSVFGRPAAMQDTAYMHSCSKVRAQSMRETSWNKSLFGVSVAHPSECLSGLEQAHLCADQDDSRIDVHATPDWNSEHVYTRVGKFYPYIGSQTRERAVKNAKGVNYFIEPLMQPSLRLMRAVNWFVPSGSPAAKLLRNLVASVTSVDPSPFEAASDVGGGSSIHRFTSNLVSKMTRYNGLHQLLTHLSVSTEMLKGLQRGSRNTDAHFQSMMLHAESCVLDLRLEQPKVILPLHYHFHRACEDCIGEIPEDEIIGDSAWLDVEFKKYDESPFLYFREEDLKMKEILPESIRTIKIRKNEFNKEQKRVLAGSLLGWRIARADMERDFDPNDVMSWTWLHLLQPSDIIRGIVVYNYVKAWHTWIMSGQVAKMSTQWSNEFIRNRVEETPLEAFGVLGNIFVDEDAEKNARCGVYPILTPVETVPNLNAAAVAIKNAVLSAISDVTGGVDTDFEVPWVPGCNTMAEHIQFVLFKRWLYRETPVAFLNQYREWWNSEERDPSVVGVTPVQMDTDIDTLAKDAGKLKFKTPRLIQMKKMKEGATGVIRLDQILPPGEWCTDRSFAKLALREPKIITGAIYKALDILEYLKLEPQTVACLGDGTGGISTLLMARGFDTFYQTLVDYHRVTQQGLSVQSPAAMKRVAIELKGRLLNKGEFASYNSDLTSASFADYFPYYQKRVFSLVWSDAEGTVWEGGEKTLRYFDNILKFARYFGTPDLTFVIKCYINKTTAPAIGYFMNNLRRPKILCTTFSTAGSGESFICGRIGTKTDAVGMVDEDLWIKKASFVGSLFPKVEVRERYSSWISSIIAERTTIDDSESVPMSIRGALKNLAASEEMSLDERGWAAIDFMIRNYEHTVNPVIFNPHQERKRGSLKYSFLHEICGFIVCMMMREMSVDINQQSALADAWIRHASACLSNKESRVRLWFVQGGAGDNPHFSEDLITIPLFRGRNYMFSKRIFSTLGVLSRHRVAFNEYKVKEWKWETVPISSHRGAHRVVVNEGKVKFVAGMGPRGNEVTDVKGAYDLRTRSRGKSNVYPTTQSFKLVDEEVSAAWLAVEQDEFELEMAD